MAEQDKRYPLVWPAGWLRTTQRRAAKFGKVRTTAEGWKRNESLTVGDGLQRLFGELGRLGARGPVVSSNLRLNLDGSITASQAKVLADPGVAVYFNFRGKPLVLACDRWNSAADNMAAIAGHIEAMRMQERYGVGTLDQAFAGYAALPAVGQTQGGDWRAELGIVGPVTSLDAVEARYRELLRVRHPDHGGSHEAIVRLNRARDDARKYLQQGAS